MYLLGESDMWLKFMDNLLSSIDLNYFFGRPNKVEV